MNFKETELPSDSDFYRVFQVQQSVDTTKRFKRDIFNYEKSRQKEAVISKIECPILGKIAIPNPV